MKRRPVYRVFVSWGGRPRPQEYTFQAATAAEAIGYGLRRAQADQLARPHEVDGVVHLCDLDRVPRARRRAR